MSKLQQLTLNAKAQPLPTTVKPFKGQGVSFSGLTIVDGFSDEARNSHHARIAVFPKK
jgi:hypothetical protein